MAARRDLSRTRFREAGVGHSDFPFGNRNDSFGPCPVLRSGKLRLQPCVYTRLDTCILRCVDSKAGDGLKRETEGILGKTGSRWETGTEVEGKISVEVSPENISGSQARAGLEICVSAGYEYPDSRNRLRSDVS